MKLLKQLVIIKIQQAVFLVFLHPTKEFNRNRNSHRFHAILPLLTYNRISAIFKKYDAPRELNDGAMI